MNDAQRFAEAFESERESWRRYERNRREKDIECPVCGGEADKATILGQTSIACHERDCLHYEIVEN